jgi:signal transduction histidine kinase
LLYSIVITGVAVSLTAFITVRTAASLWEREFTERNVAFASYTSLDVLRIFGGSFTGTLTGAGEEEIRRLAVSNGDLVGVMILTESGRSLFSTLEDEFAARLSSSWPDGVESAVGSVIELQQAAWGDHRVAGGRFLDVLSPVAGQGGIRPIAIRYAYDFSSLDEKINNLVNRVILGSLLLVVLVAAFSAILSGFLVRPVRVLTGSARQISEGDNEHRISLHTGDEMEELSTQFNTMVDTLQEKQHQLEAANREMTTANEQLRELQSHLVRSERLAVLGQLSAGVSHELDNPIGVILGYSELLGEELPEGHPAIEYAHVMKEEAKRCKRIIAGLLDFARPGAGHSQDIDLAASLHELSGHLASQRPFKEVEIVVNAPVETAPVRVDPDALRQVLVNLALNSSQAMAGRGRISFLLTGSGADGRDGYSITVEDTGPGLRNGSEEKVFEPFYTTKPKGQGTGLGLSICRKLIEEAGGKITAEAADGGKFVIWLPCVKG